MSEEDTFTQPTYTISDLERELREESSPEEREREALFTIVALALQDPDNAKLITMVSDVLREFKLEALLQEVQGYLEDEAAEEDEEALHTDG